LAIEKSAENSLDLHAVIVEYAKLTNSPEPYERVVGSLCVAGILTKHLAVLSEKSGNLYSITFGVSCRGRAQRWLFAKKPFNDCPAQFENDTTKTV
jgi:hypothetical protein